MNVKVEHGGFMHSDNVELQKLIDVHKARLLTKLEDIKSCTPLIMEIVKSQFFYMTQDFDKFIVKGKSHDNTK